MASVVLPQGTTEFLIVAVDDRLDNMTAGIWITTVAKFDVKNQAGTLIYTAATALPDIDDAGEFGVIGGFILRCMVDTDTTGPLGTLWPAGTYRLYADLTTTPEVPRLGPYEFEVSSA